jgi:hypothetical protein
LDKEKKIMSGAMLFIIFFFLNPSLNLRERGPTDLMVNLHIFSMEMSKIIKPNITSLTTPDLLSFLQSYP